MRMARVSITTLTMAALLSLSAAAAATAQDESEPASAPAEPFAAILSGTVSFEPLEEPTDECPLGVKTITDAAGPSTLGEVTLHAEHCPTPGLPSVPEGVQTLTAAEGDELTGVYFVDCDPVMPSAESGEPVTCVGRFGLTGGTGVFAEATGSAAQTAFVWFPGSMAVQDWPYLTKLEGVIEY